MKKFIFLAAASLVLLASCEKEKNNNGPASTGVTGEWVADHVTLAFQHPDLTSIDLSVISPELGEIAISDIVAMGNEAINTGLKEDPSVSADLILTEDGNLIIDGLDVPITYTVDNSTLNVHVDQSVISGIAEQIKNEQDVMDILSQLGLSGLVENPQSVDLPLTYSVSESSLSLTADQNTAAPYMEMLAPAVETLTGHSLTYEMFSALLENAGLELADTVTPENFPAIKQLILDVFSALTDGKAEYSLTTDFIPYAG